MFNKIYGADGIQVLMIGSSPYISNNGSLSGTVRYNSNLQNFEIYDGSTWLQYNHGAEISLSADTKDLLQWVRIKMAEEEKLRKMSEHNTAVKAAYDAFKKAEEQLKVVALLSTEENQ